MSPRSSTVGPGRDPSSTATTDVTALPEVHLQRQVGERVEHGVAGAGRSRPSSGCRCSARRSATVRGCTVRACARSPARSASSRGTARSWHLERSLRSEHRARVTNFDPTVWRAGQLRVVVWTTVEAGLTVWGMAVQSVEAPADVRERPCPDSPSPRSGRRVAGAAPGMATEALVDLDTAITELRGAALHRRGARPARRRRRVLRAAAARPGRGVVDGVRRGRRPRLRRRRRRPRPAARRAARRRRGRSTPRRGPRAISRSSPISGCPPTSWRCWRPSRSSTRTSSSRRSAAVAGSPTRWPRSSTGGDACVDDGSPAPAGRSRPVCDRRGADAARPRDRRRRAAHR